MIVLSSQDVRKALPMQGAVAAMQQAYAALSDNRAQVPLRLALPIPWHQASGLFMPAYVYDQSGGAMVVKAVALDRKSVV